MDATIIEEKGVLEPDISLEAKMQFMNYMNKSMNRYNTKVMDKLKNALDLNQ